MNPSEARLELLGQHEHLRTQLSLCTRLATLYRAGEDVGSALDAALSELREDFATHNQTESTIIGRLLHGPSAWGSLLVDRMLEEHVAEHAAFWELLSGSRGEVAGRIDELAEELDAHMAAEERTFLAPVTLQETVIRKRCREETVE